MPEFWAKVETAFHASCTCEMGSKNNPMAVLDSDCRVRGVKNLHVVDSEVFPTISNGNLNAPPIMAAEKAADIILGLAPLPESSASVWIDEDWENQQRVKQALRNC